VVYLLFSQLVCDRGMCTSRSSLFFVLAYHSYEHTHERMWSRTASEYYPSEQKDVNNGLQGLLLGKAGVRSRLW
jgi:hypothetical protein